MPLPFTINGFKYGLDTRKDVLSSQPGTLVTGENVFVNQGAELEKRKAFVLFADVDIDDGNGDQGTFGIESTSSGIIVFGSALTFGTSPTQSQPVLASAIPAGVTYQQLVHPTLINDSSEAYSRTLHRMTRLVFSENYNGLAFACALFADGRKFLYYDGDLIQQSANGLVMTNRTSVSDLSVDLVRQIEAIGWRAFANVDENDVAQAGSTIVQSPQSDYFTALPEDSSTAGYIGAKSISQNGTKTPGKKALAAFKITVNTGTFTVTAPENSDGSGSIDLCGGAIAALGSATLTAAAIASAINDLTDYHGYQALSLVDDTFIYAPEDWGNFTFNLTVTVTTGTVTSTASTPVALAATILPSPLTVEVISQLLQPIIVAGDASVSASGGTPLYTYNWAEVTSGSGNGITIANATTPTATFSATLNPGSNISVSGNFKCTITDSAAPTASVVVQLTVTLRRKATIFS